MPTPANNTATDPSTSAPQATRQDQATDHAAVSQAAGATATKVKKPKRSPDEIFWEQKKTAREAAEKAEAAAWAGWQESQRKVKLIAGYQVIGVILERAENASRESVISSVQSLANEQENQVLAQYLDALATAPPPAAPVQKKGAGHEKK